MTWHAGSCIGRRMRHHRSMNWSPFTDEAMADPASGHQYLLDTCPVHCCDGFDPPFFTLSRYEDVQTALRDIETYSSHFGQGPRFTEPAGMLCDPPQHTFYRKILQSWFTPKAVEALREPVTRLTHELVDGILSGPDEFDAHDDFAFPLPVTIIADLLGVPKSDLEQFKHWSDIQVAAMGSAKPEQYLPIQQEFMAYMHSHLMQRRKQIADGVSVPEDLLTLLAGARTEEGEFTPEPDSLSVLNQLLVGGNETTTSLVTNLIWRLLEVPERWQMIVDDPSLIRSAIEESLRYDPPVLGLYRNTTREVRLHGEVIPSGSKVFINYAAANRDASVYPNPDEFDVTRNPQRHMSFGLGVHFCLGAPTARLETEIALSVLRERMPELRLLGAGERIAPFFLWGRRKLPVSWKR
ncbi:MAG: cytochrome P450 [Gammaproteobacteria bacterium]|nr:cytochrome P450 [Gammaproteobacteria bacterium]